VQLENDRSDGTRTPLSLPADWGLTVDRFMTAGLVPDDLADAVEIAMTATTKGVRQDKVWNYLCGVCWKKVRARQEAVAEVLASDELASRRRAGGAG
jgi:hypothetical protein